MSGCGKTPQLINGPGIPEINYRGIEPFYADGITVENLTESYFRNTEALVIVNGKLSVLCKAAKKEDCSTLKQVWTDDLEE
jgi:hypothetical protein